MHDQEIYLKFHQIVDVRNAIYASNFDGLKGKRYLAIFDYCLNSLKEEYRFILEKSYLERNYQYWWLDYFCQSSYYRKRFWAINCCVHLFEMIHENFNDYSNAFNFAC